MPARASRASIDLAAGFALLASWCAFRSEAPLQQLSTSASYVERALPARVSKEVQRHMRNPGDIVANAGLLKFTFSGLERPVIEERPAHDILARDKAPISRVEAVVAIVAHHKELPGWNDEITIYNVTWKFISPCVRSAGVRVAVSYRRNGRKFIKERGEVCLCCRLRVRIRMLLAVDVDDSIVKMKMIARNSDLPLHQEQNRRFAVCVDRPRFDEDHDVATFRFAIVNEWHPLAWRCQRDAINNEMVADKKRLLHRAGRDHKVLCKKGENEKADNQN